MSTGCTWSPTWLGAAGCNGATPCRRRRPSPDAARWPSECTWRPNSPTARSAGSTSRRPGRRSAWPSISCATRSTCRVSRVSAPTRWAW